MSAAMAAADDRMSTEQAASFVNFIVIVVSPLWIYCSVMSSGV
jgi:hypothetical protein